jgi:UDP-glucose 4-epimerase
MDPYVIWGTGEQDRNFTYVSDTIEGFILTMEKITDGSPVNIGTSEHIKIKEAAEKIFEYTRFRPRNILFDTSKPEGVFSRAADISRTKKILNWEPKVSFDNGLKQTIDWYYATKDKDAVAQKLQTLLNER